MLLVRSSPDALLAEANAAIIRGAGDEARVLCRQVLRRLREATEPAATASAVARTEARVALAEGDFDAALDALDAAHTLAQLSGSASAVAHCVNGIAIVYFRRGQFDDAERLFEATRASARAASDLRLMALTSLNVGALAINRGEYAKALSHMQRALVDFRREHCDDYVRRTLSNLGIVYTRLARWPEAEHAFAEAIRLCESASDVETLALSRVSEAEMWVARGEFDQARRSCEAAREACERTTHLATLGEVSRVLGVIARDGGQSTEADAHFADAERIAIERDDLVLLAETAREQAELYRAQGRNRDTFAALNRSHRIFSELRAQRAVADIDRRMGRLESDFVEVARRWGESIEANDRYTQGHCQRVADLSCLIAARAGLDAQSLFWFRIGALLHDVGKLVISSEVLNKPGKLTDDEWALVRSHPSAGVEVLRDIEFPWDIRPIVESHHERWDGKGYPHGLSGEAIPLVARILCVADVYDALTSVRSYKRSLTHDEAMEILRKDSGTAFDPQVFTWFEEIAPRWKERAAALGAADVPDETAREAAHARRAAGLDELTGLPRRAAFQAECSRVLAARARDGRPSAVLLLAVQTPGAAKEESGDGSAVAPPRRPADASLAMVGEVLSRNTRGGDFVGRYGDHEFVVLLPDVTYVEAHGTAERLRDAIAAQRGAGLGDSGSRAPDVVVTVGVAAAPEHGAAVEALVAAAETALRRAQRGRPPASAGGSPLLAASLLLE